MRELRYIHIPTRSTAFLLGLIYLLALIGKGVHRHNPDVLSAASTGTALLSVLIDDKDDNASNSGARASIVPNLDCDICDFYIGITDQCPLAPTFAVEEWSEVAPTIQLKAVHIALRKGKALRAPPVRYC